MSIGRVSRVVPLFLLVMMLLTGSIAVGAQDERAPAQYFSLTGLNTTGCAIGGTQFSYTSLRSTPHFIGTFARASGETYMDENASLSILGVVNGVWTLFNSNNRDRRTMTMPMLAGSPITVESTMFSPDYEPQWRTTVRVSSCENGSFTHLQDYKAKDLLSNNSFEVSAAGEPTNWIPNSNALAGPSGVECSAAFPGSCSLRIVPQFGTNIKYSQTWTGSKGGAGETLELAFLQQISANYTGGGSVKANLTFANGATAKLKIYVMRSLVAPWRLSYESMIMPAALTSATVTIKQKSGVGDAWRLDGLSLAIYTPTAAPLAPVPPPAAPAMRGFDRGVVALPQVNGGVNGD